MTVDRLREGSLAFGDASSSSFASPPATRVASPMSVAEPPPQEIRYSCRLQAASHTTILDLLDRLCPHHHDLKTIDNWALVEGRGKRAFVPPDDPRHPRRPARAA